MESEGSLPCSQEPSTSPYPEPDYSSLYHPILRPILTLSTLVVSFFRDSSPLSYMHYFSPHSCYIPCTSHPLWLHHSNDTWWRLQVMKPSLCSFLQPHVTSSLFDPNILLNTLFSSTSSPCCSLNVRDQVSHQYRTTCKIIIFYIPIFMFLGSRRKDRMD
jgi:hypothetical protein